MKNAHISEIAKLSVLAFFLLTSACNKPGDNAEGTTQISEKPNMTGKMADLEDKVRMLYAAESFEALTQAAANGDQSKIGSAMASAMTSGALIRGILISESRLGFEKEMASIRSAEKAKDITGVALMSNEAYRRLVSASAGALDFPVEVSLLKYAGFRYDANLKAKPSRWTDMTEATLFAQRQWAQIEPKLKQPALAGEIGKALADMKKAAETKNSIMAATSVEAELILVDRLETALGKTS